jgi:hypothetical protein
MLAEYNYFGTIEPSVINAMVLDRNDSLTRNAVIDISPWLNAPNDTASAVILVGTANSDQIAGLAGLDTVVFSGARLDYEISRANGAVTVRDVRAQGDGTDTLTGIERLQFSDGFMGLVPEELLLFLPGTRDLITWDSTQGSNGFTYFFRLNATTNIAAVADLTGDGRADLLLAQPGGGFIRKPRPPAQPARPHEHGSARA